MAVSLERLKTTANKHAQIGGTNGNYLPVTKAHITKRQALEASAKE